MNRCTVTEPRLRRLFEAVDRGRWRHLERLRAYLCQPSISRGGEGVGETAELLARTLGELGLESRLLDAGGNPIVLGRRPGRSVRTVLLYGHYDVQPPGPGWSSDPFGAELRDGRVYARGAADNKGQHLAQLLAVEALLEAEGELPCNVVVVLDGEEEIGSPTLAPFVERHAGELAADLVVAADGSAHPSGAAQVILGCRGYLPFELRAEGAKRDLHSGAWGGLAPNPAWKLLRVLASMRSDEGRITVPGLFPGPRLLSPEEERAQAELAVDEIALRAELGLSNWEEPVERPYWQRLAAYPTLTVNSLRAGGERAVVPASASARCDMRLLPGQRCQEVVECLRTHVREVDPEVELRLVGGAVEPSQTPLDSPFLAPIQQAVALGRGCPPLVVPLIGGTLPLHVWTEKLGIPAFIVSHANSDAGNHGPDENLRVDAFLGTIKSTVAMLLALGETGSEFDDS